MTLTRYFIHLLEEKKMNPAALSRKTGVNPSIFTRFKKGGGISVETLRVVLTKGFGYTQSDHQYLEAMSLWLAENTRSAGTDRLALRIGSAEGTRDRNTSELVNAIVDAMKSLKEDDRVLLLEAIRRPEAVRHWLESVRAMQAPSPAQKPKKAPR